MGKINVKVGSVDEAMWSRVLKNAKQQLMISEETVKIQLAIIDLAQNKIIEEKEKFK